MDDKDLKGLFDNTPVPPPDEEAKKRALLMAREAFKKSRQESTQGFPGLVRLMGKMLEKLLPKGGRTMNKPAYLTGGALALATLLVASAIVLTMSATMQKEYKPSNITTAPTVTTEARQPMKADDSTVTTVAPPPPIEQVVQEVKEERKSIELGGLKSEVDQAPSVDAMRSMPAAVPAPASQGLTMQRQERAKQAYNMAPPPMLAAEPPALKDQLYIGRDRFDSTKPNPVKLAAQEPVSTFSIDTDTASYAFVRKMLTSGVLPQPNAVRIEELINYFDYDYKVPTDRSKPFEPTVALYPTPWNPDTRLLHIAIKGYDIAPTSKPRANLVFLIDVSGSMESADKLPLLKDSLSMLVDTLSPDDRVGIVVYAGAAGVVLEPTEVREKGRIRAVLGRLQAGGSTAGGEGIKLAYDLAQEHFDAKGVNRVILATDGDFNVGITDTNELKGFIERMRKTGIYLSVLGFGAGNLNDSLMQALAQNGNGNASYIDTLNEARKVLVDEATSTLFPIANDVKIQVEFNPERVAEYRLIGYETRMLRREDFNNDSVDAGEVGAGHAVTALYEIAFTDGPGRLVDDLRYGDKRTEAKASGKPSEIGFLKIRYKLPGENTSRLITRPIAKGDEYASVATAPADMRFAAAVAAYGQILRGDPYTKTFTMDDVTALAMGAKGQDPYGIRAEFVNLARMAKSAAAMKYSTLN